MVPWAMTSPVRRMRWNGSPVEVKVSVRRTPCRAGMSTESTPRGIRPSSTVSKSASPSLSKARQAVPAGMVRSLPSGAESRKRSVVVEATGESSR